MVLDVKKLRDQHWNAVMAIDQEINKHKEKIKVLETAQAEHFHVLRGLVEVERAKA